jgi:hypothetical protein
MQVRSNAMWLAQARATVLLLSAAIGGWAQGVVLLPRVQTRPPQTRDPARGLMQVRAAVLLLSVAIEGWTQGVVLLPRGAVVNGHSHWT